MHADLLKRLLPLVSINPNGPAIGAELLAEGHALDAAQWSGDAMLDEADPRTTAAMLADWERVYGLPDPFLPPRTLALDPGLYAVTVDHIAAFSQPEVTTYIDAGGQLRYASPNTPRFDYDPVTHEARGLLIEASATNVLWGTRVLGGATLATSSTTGPDGVLAKKVVCPSGVVSFPAVAQGANIPMSLTSGQTIDIAFTSYFAAGVSGMTVEPRIIIGVATSPGFTNPLYAELQINTSTMAVRSKVLPAQFTEVMAPTIVLQPCGMYLVTWVVRFAADATNRDWWYSSINMRDTFGSGTFVGDGVGSFIYALPQAEVGAPTSYIPTTTGPVTRPADICSIFDRLSIPERISALVAKVLMQGGQSRAFFIALAAALGYTITITELTPQTTEFDTEVAVADEQYRFIWQVNAALYALRELTTESGTEMPTAVWDNGLLEVVLNRYKPAHTLALYAYS